MGLGGGANSSLHPPFRRKGGAPAPSPLVTGLNRHPDKQRLQFYSQQPLKYMNRENIIDSKSHPYHQQGLLLHPCNIYPRETELRPADILAGNSLIDPEPVLALRKFS